MADLQAGYRYLMSTEERNNKSVIFVKLTDSALESIEAYLNSKDVTSTPTIQFQDNSGVISLPLNGAKHNYVFTLSNIEGDGLQSGFQCLQHIDNSLHSLGFFTKKIQIHAKEDTYEKTKSKMTAAEQEQKNLCTKELQIGCTKLADQVIVKHSELQCLPEISLNSELKQLSLKTKATHPDTVMQQSIRKRIIHILAAKAYKKAELLLRLKRDGISDKDKNRINDILGEISNLKGNSLSLKDHVWDEVQEDWELYSKEELQSMKRKRKQFLNSRNVNEAVGLFSIKQENPFSSTLDIDMNIDQKPNILVNNAEYNTNQKKYSDPYNNTLTNGCTMHSTKDSSYSQVLNGNLKKTPKKRGRPHLKKNVDEIDGSHLPRDGTQSIQSTKCTAITNLPTLRKSFVCQTGRKERLSVKNEENMCSETVSNGHDINQEENGTSNLMIQDTVSPKKPSNCNNVPKLQVQLSDNVQLNPNNKGKYWDKLQEFKQLLLNPPSSHNDTTQKGNKNKNNDSKAVNNQAPVKAEPVKEYDFSQIQQEYTKIESPEERSKYVREFYNDYSTYLLLRDEVKKTSDKISNLHHHLEKLPEESSEKEKIRHEIKQEYRTLQKNSYVASKNKYLFLKDKLSHIQKLIAEYDLEKNSEL